MIENRSWNNNNTYFQNVNLLPKLFQSIIFINHLWKYTTQFVSSKRIRITIFESHSQCETKQHSLKNYSSHDANKFKRRQVEKSRFSNRKHRFSNEHGCNKETKTARLSRVGSKTHSFRETARRSRRCEAVDFCARAEAVLIFLEVGYTHARVIDISHARRACRPATNLARGRRFRVVLDSRRKRTALFWPVIKVTQEEWEKGGKGGGREGGGRVDLSTKAGRRWIIRPGP